MAATKMHSGAAESQSKALPTSCLHHISDTESLAVACLYSVADAESVSPRHGKVLEATVRTFAGMIQSDPNVTDQQKADAGLPIHKTTRTPVPVLDSALTVEVETCNVQEHRIRFFDTNNTMRRSRPKGVFGIEIYRFVGDAAPTDDQQYSMYGIATRMNAIVHFTGDEVGKYAWYRFRYVNKRGEAGP